MDDNDFDFTEDLDDDPNHSTSMSMPLPQSNTGSAAPVPVPVYSDVLDFFADVLSRGYARHVTDRPDRTWCPRWFDHDEAIVRVTALWHSWEHLRLDPATGISVWLRDHADHHMQVLMSPDGPFAGCDARRGHHCDEPITPLPTDRSPAAVDAA